MCIQHLLASMPFQTNRQLAENTAIVVASLAVSWAIRMLPVQDEDGPPSSPESLIPTKWLQLPRKLGGGSEEHIKDEFRFGLLSRNMLSAK
jgi:hypothetical protein